MRRLEGNRGLRLGKEIFSLSVRLILPFACSDEFKRQKRARRMGRSGATSNADTTSHTVDTASNAADLSRTWSNRDDVETEGVAGSAALSGLADKLVDIERMLTRIIEVQNKHGDMLVKLQEDKLGSSF